MQVCHVRRQLCVGKRRVSVVSAILRSLAASTLLVPGLQVLWVGGLGNQTYFPPWITKFPQDTRMAMSKKEFDMIVVEACR